MNIKMCHKKTHDNINLEDRKTDLDTTTTLPPACVFSQCGIHQYTGCPRRNVPDFGRAFLMLKYADITQNIYVQS
jgi:hypothetical protein